MLGGFVFGIWNNVSTALNATTLYEKDHRGFAALTIFFLVCRYFSKFTHGGLLSSILISISTYSVFATV